MTPDRIKHAGHTYERVGETIQYKKKGPGKFDDNVQEQLYEYILDGGGDESLGDVEGFGAYDLLLFGSDPLTVQYEDGSKEVIKGAIVQTDNQGFVYTQHYDSEEAARADWAIVETEYADWLGPEEHDEYGD